MKERKTNNNYYMISFFIGMAIGLAFGIVFERPIIGLSIGLIIVFLKDIGQIKYF